MLRAVIEEHPDDQDAHYSLAIVCFSSGRVDEAKEQWQTAAGIDPRSTTGRRSQSFVDLLEDQQSGAPAGGLTGRPATRRARPARRGRGRARSG